MPQGDSPYRDPAWTSRTRIRRLLDGMQPGDTVRFRIDAQTLRSDVAGLIPAGVHAQVEGPDATIVRRFLADLE